MADDLDFLNDLSPLKYAEYTADEEQIGDDITKPDESAKDVLPKRNKKCAKKKEDVSTNIDIANAKIRKIRQVKTTETVSDKFVLQTVMILRLCPSCQNNICTNPIKHFEGYLISIILCSQCMKVNGQLGKLL